MSLDSSISSPTAAQIAPVLQHILERAGISSTGNPVMLNFFRTDCPWCATFVPHLSEIYSRHDFKLKIDEIGVACGGNSREMAEKFKREKLIVFPIITDEGGHLAPFFGVSRVPSIVVIGASGQIERVYSGVTEQLSGILEHTLFAVANRQEPPEYDMVGNGCAP